MTRQGLPLCPVAFELPVMRTVETQQGQGGKKAERSDTSLPQERALAKHWGRNHTRSLIKPSAYDTSNRLSWTALRQRDATLAPALGKLLKHRGANDTRVIAVSKVEPTIFS
jgi:hypothetical protein